MIQSSFDKYDKASENERDYLITDSDGFAQTKELPYGTYTVHQTKTVNDAECVADFDVNIFEDGKNHEYILNDKPFKSYIKVTIRSRKSLLPTDMLSLLISALLLTNSARSKSAALCPEFVEKDNKDE